MDDLEDDHRLLPKSMLDHSELSVVPLPLFVSLKRRFLLLGLSFLSLTFTVSLNWVYLVENYGSVPRILCSVS